MVENEDTGPGWDRETYSCLGETEQRPAQQCVLVGLRRHGSDSLSAHDQKSVCLKG